MSPARGPTLSPARGPTLSPGLSPRLLTCSFLKSLNRFAAGKNFSCRGDTGLSMATCSISVLSDSVTVCSVEEEDQAATIPSSVKFLEVGEFIFFKAITDVGACTLPDCFNATSSCALSQAANNATVNKNKM